MFVAAAAAAVGVIVATSGVARGDPRSAVVRFHPSHGFEAVTDDKAFRLAIGARLQTLYSFELRDDDAKQAFQLRRARVILRTAAFGEHNKLKLELALSPRDVGIAEGQLTRSPLLTYIAILDHLRDLTLVVGQYKVPYSRQRVVSSAKMQLVDRSLVNAEFNLDRDVGLDLRSKDLLGLGVLRYAVGVYIGEGRDASGLGDFGVMFIGRVEVLPFGLFDDYSEADHSRSKRFRLSIGAAYAYLDDGKNDRGILGERPADGGTTDFHNATVDLSARWRGASLEAAWMWRRGTRHGGDAVDDNGVAIPVALPRNGHGFYVQGGYLFGWPALELVARLSMIEPLGESVLQPLRAAGGGLSWYFGREHKLKLQLDAFHIWSRRDPNAGTTRVRLQLEVGL